MKKFLLSWCLCVFALPAFGQGEQAITIIGDDGSKQIVPIDSASPSKKSVVRVPKVEKANGVVPNPVYDVPSLVTKQEPLAAPQVSVEEAHQKAVQQMRDGSQAPVKPAVKPKNTKIEKNAEPISGDDNASDAPKPLRKPTYRRVDPAIASGQPIDKEAAMSIALGVAPPSRDIQVTSFSDDKGLMYSVVFKTDDGLYEVLVDAVTREILRSEYKDEGQASVKPGHLPVR